MKASLILEDGRIFSGQGFGSEGERIGEVIFNTAVVGYQEMITDPANAGKILVMTYPLIGNYGVAPKFNESKKAWLEGLVIKEKSRLYSNWQAKESLEAFMKKQGLVGISGIDTRTLAVHLRQKGEMFGMISTRTGEAKELLAKVVAFKKKPKESLLAKISLARPLTCGKAKAGKRVAILDLGITQSLIRQLEALGLSLTILPYHSVSGAILKNRPHGLIVSGGPEADTGLKAVAQNIKPLIGRIPMLGISAGHQVLAQALGAKVIKLKTGHRGVNYPINHPASYKGEITAQNHGYVVDGDSLARIKQVKITAYNLNDRSVEEMESRTLKLIGIQYLAVSPGFNQVNPVLKKFLKILR